jgi:hypothetical protein
VGIILERIQYFSGHPVPRIQPRTRADWNVVIEKYLSSFPT